MSKKLWFLVIVGGACAVVYSVPAAREWINEKAIQFGQAYKEEEQALRNALLPTDDAVDKAKTQKVAMAQRPAREQSNNTDHWDG